MGITNASCSNTVDERGGGLTMGMLKASSSTWRGDHGGAGNAGSRDENDMSPGMQNASPSMIMGAIDRGAELSEDVDGNGGCSIELVDGFLSKDEGTEVMFAWLTSITRTSVGIGGCSIGMENASGSYKGRCGSCTGIANASSGISI